MLHGDEWEGLKEVRRGGGGDEGNLECGLRIGGHSNLCWQERSTGERNVMRLMKGEKE